jgi:hypothetical protein
MGEGLPADRMVERIVKALGGDSIFLTVDRFRIVKNKVKNRVLPLQVAVRELID